jgi:hypothetical protein
VPIRPNAVRREIIAGTPDFSVMLNEGRPAL